MLTGATAGVSLLNVRADRAHTEQGTTYLLSSRPLKRVTTLSGSTFLFRAFKVPKRAEGGRIGDSWAVPKGSKRDVTSSTSSPDLFFPLNTVCSSLVKMLRARKRAMTWYVIDRPAA
jgi:hypothetical protein